MKLFLLKLLNDAVLEFLAQETGTIPPEIATQVSGIQTAHEALRNGFSALTVKK